MRSAQEFITRVCIIVMDWIVGEFFFIFFIFFFPLRGPGGEGLFSVLAHARAPKIH